MSDSTPEMTASQMAPSSISQKHLTLDQLAVVMALFNPGRTQALIP